VKRKPANRRPAGPRSDQICSLLRVTRLAPSKLTLNTAPLPRKHNKIMPLPAFLKFQLQLEMIDGPNRDRIVVATHLIVQEK
jgi:hypothetical protein